MTSDAGRRETNKILAEMEQRIQKEYERAANEVTLKLDKHLESFKYKDAKKRIELKAGNITQKEYDNWRTGQIMIGERWKAMSETLAQDYHRANEIAKGIVNGYMPEIYSVNFNYGTYEIEHGTQLDTAFTLYNRNAVEWMIRDNPDLLPPVGKTVSQRIAEGKDIRWNKQQINSVMTQAILQGESIPKIARRLADEVGEKNYKAAIRNARTMTTRAENYGRLDSYKRAKSLGIETQKQWVATLDHVTRDSHVDVDGEVVDLDKSFSNGLDCPGGMGPPEEVYNCRCTMISVIKGFAIDATDPSVRRMEKLGDMSYSEWKQAHQSRLPEDELERRNKIREENMKSAPSSQKKIPEGDGTWGENQLGHKYTKAEYDKRLEELNQYGNYHYHATTESAVKGIMDKGLVPSEGHAGCEVYMAKTSDSALEWAESTSTSGKVVMRVNNEYLAKTDYLDYDKTKGGEGSTASTIPAGEIEVRTYDGRWIPLEKARLQYNRGVSRIVSIDSLR